MCVILFKPKGQAMPGIDVLRACFRANPHGVGFVTPGQFYKTMSYEKFIDKIGQVSDDEPCIIHFRYATHGSIKTANCHPFKGSIRGHKPIYFAHNGVLSIRPIGDMTDSETAFQTKFLPVAKEYGLRSKELEEVVEKYRGGSRFAFMQGDKVSLFGNFVQREGCYFSNLNFTSYLNAFNMQHKKYLSWY